jgi:hypothetical protein
MTPVRRACTAGANNCKGSTLPRRKRSVWGGTMGNSMARLVRLESRESRVVAGLLSVMLHFVLLLFLVFSGGRQDGIGDADTPITQVVMLESPRAEHRAGSESGLLKSAVAEAHFRERPNLEAIKPPSPLVPDPEPDARSDDTADVDHVDEAKVASDTTLVESVAPTEPVVTGALDPLSTTFVMPHEMASELLQRIERLARKKLTTTPRAVVAWQQNGERYKAELVLERARNGLELDRVIAEISAENQGRHLWTRITLKRRSFSQFAQIIDFWDPMVQLHNDEVVGRMHINSRFNVLYDSEARPTLLGKVSTAAGSFNMQSSGRAREADVFLEGLETRAGRITLSEQVDPLELAPHDENARIHQFANDTRIIFFADGSYWWRDSKSTEQHRNEPSAQPVYFIAARGATLYVRGVVSGKMLIYSPQKIVVEGSLTYAHDPRILSNSGDYLGLVCGKDIEVAPPVVTGPGDVDIHAALFAKRRFVVTAFDYPHPATLRVYGSLAAGMITATEPRYATKVEYDSRFEELRPPGFPSMNRFTVEDWDRRWTEAPALSTTSNDF